MQKKGKEKPEPKPQHRFRIPSPLHRCFVILLTVDEACGFSDVLCIGMLAPRLGKLRNSPYETVYGFCPCTFWMPLREVGGRLPIDLTLCPVHILAIYFRRFLLPCYCFYAVLQQGEKEKIELLLDRFLRYNPGLIHRIVENLSFKSRRDAPRMDKRELFRCQFERGPTMLQSKG